MKPLLLPICHIHSWCHSNTLQTSLSLPGTLFHIKDRCHTSAGNKWSLLLSLLSVTTPLYLSTLTLMSELLMPCHMDLTVRVRGCEVGECKNSWHRSAGRCAVIAVDLILSTNTKSGKLNGRLWQKALRSTEQKGQLGPWVVLLELVLPAVQASNLFPEFFFTYPLPFHLWLAHHHPAIFGPDFSSSSLVP